MKSIKTKLILLTLLVSAVTLVTMTAIAIGAVNNTMGRSFDSFMTPLADQTAKTLSSDMNNTLEKLSAVSQIPSISNSSVQTDMASDVQKFMSSVDVKVKDYAFFSTGKTAIYSSSDKAKGYAEYAEYTKAISTKEEIITGPITDGDNTYFVCFAPVIDSTDNTSYVLAASIDYSFVNDLVNKIKFGKTGSAYIMDANGAITTAKKIEDAAKKKNPSELAKTDKAQKSIAELHNTIIKDKDKQGYTKFKFEGKKYVAGYSYISFNQSYLVETAPIADFSEQTLLMIVCIGSAIVMLGIAFLFTRKITKTLALPIISASERLKSLAEGNLTDPVKIVNTKDELYVLTTALQDTIITLKTYITRITDALTNIADGDLTDRVHGSFRGDFIKIKSTFNTILASLIDTFTNIDSASEQVNSGANQVSNGAQALSQGATEQASAIQELSATISDVSTQVTENAKSAKVAEEIMEDTTERILLCNNDMNNMLNAMQEINASSNEISKIIKVIDDIAFQTNILALNAAVEAARAGSAGKGFAVVADEVRSLAAKSAEAAKQTTALIEGSVNTVNRGSKIAKQTANALADIVEKSKDINIIVKNISKASEEQANSIDQITSGVDQISGVVQTNTATAEESAAASEELSAQSTLLSNLISKFRLGDKAKIFGEDSAYTNSFSSQSSQFDFSNSNTASETQFNFGGTAEPETQFNFGGTAEPETQFNFGGSTEPETQFNFGGSTEPETQFNFGGSTEPETQFNFGGSTEPENEFKFGGSTEPENEFKFGGSTESENTFNGSFKDDLKINLDDDDSKY